MKCIFCAGDCMAGEHKRYNGIDIYHLRCTICSEYHVDEQTHHSITEPDYCNRDRTISRDELEKIGSKNKEYFEENKRARLYLLSGSQVAEYIPPDFENRWITIGDAFVEMGNSSSSSQ